MNTWQSNTLMQGKRCKSISVDTRMKCISPSYTPISAKKPFKLPIFDTPLLPISGSKKECYLIPQNSAPKRRKSEILLNKFNLIDHKHKPEEESEHNWCLTDRNTNSSLSNKSPSSQTMMRSNEKLAITGMNLPFLSNRCLNSRQTLVVSGMPAIKPKGISNIKSSILKKIFLFQQRNIAANSIANATKHIAAEKAVCHRNIKCKPKITPNNSISPWKSE